MKKSYWFIYLIISLNLFGRTLMLDEAVELAGYQNLEIQEKEFEEKIQEKRVYSKKKDLLPKLSIVTTLEDGEKGGDRTSETDLLFGGTLYSGGKILNSINLEEKQYEVSTLNKNIKKKNIGFLTTKTYLECLKAIEKKEIVLKSLEFYEKSYEKNKELKELNLITKAELLGVKSEFSKRRLDLIEVENSIKNLKISLKKLTGINNQEKLDLIGIKELNLTEKKFITNDSFEGNMETNLSSIGVETATLEKKISLGSFAPEINYYIGFNESQNNFSDTYSDFQGLVGVSFKLDIFSWGQKLDEIAIADMEINRRKVSKQNEIEVQNEKLSLLINDLDSLEEGINQSKLAIKNYEEKFKYYEESYRYKIISVDEYLDSEQDLLDEKIRLVDLNYNYKIKKEEILTLLK